MEIFIKTLSGKNFTLNVDPSDCVSDVKDQIHKKEGVPQEQQRIIFAGKILEDPRSLAQYGIQRESTLHIIYRLSNGIQFAQLEEANNADEPVFKEKLISEPHKQWVQNIFDWLLHSPKRPEQQKSAHDHLMKQVEGADLLSSYPDLFQIEDLVASQIFSLLSFSDLRTCMKVSKKWYKIANHPAIWRHMDFSSRMGRISHEHFELFLQLHGSSLLTLSLVQCYNLRDYLPLVAQYCHQLKRFECWGLGGLGDMAKLLSQLAKCHSLETLALNGLNMTQEDINILDSFPNLKSLTLEDFGARVTAPVFSSQTLTALALPRILEGMDVTKCPNLRLVSVVNWPQTKDNFANVHVEMLIPTLILRQTLLSPPTDHPLIFEHTKELVSILQKVSNTTLKTFPNFCNVYHLTKSHQ